MSTERSNSLLPSFSHSLSNAFSAAAANSTTTATSANNSTVIHNHFNTIPPVDRAPQAAFGWFVNIPPPHGPYLWPCLPDGYQLLPTGADKSINESKQQQNNKIKNQPITKVKVENTNSTNYSTIDPGQQFNVPPQVAW
jgi:hypothetical protein